jgi:hypothetical protein
MKGYLDDKARLEMEELKIPAASRGLQRTQRALGLVPHSFLSLKNDLLHIKETFFPNENGVSKVIHNRRRPVRLKCVLVLIGRHGMHAF